jgi:hypothetical protein
METKHMRTLMRTLLAAVVLLTPLSLPAQAPPPPGPPEQLRGVVQALQGDTLTVRNDAGGTDTIMLAQGWTVSMLKPVDVSAIKPGSFIGTAEMPQKGNTGRSLEVHVFPPGVKAGEGHYAWGLKKGSMMTNGTVGKVTASGTGRELQVSYPNGERKIVVPSGIPIVQITDGERSQIKPGIPVFLLVTKTPDGKTSAGFVSIGENGTRPPM